MADGASVIPAQAWSALPGAFSFEGGVRTASVRFNVLRYPARYIAGNVAQRSNHGSSKARRHAGSFLALTAMMVSVGTAGLATGLACLLCQDQQIPPGPRGRRIPTGICKCRRHGSCKVC